jgi:glycerophosphoryl diester phosphodiesterase
MAAKANQRPLLLGHRGCRLRSFDENSIVAFEHALASGCDGFEFDIRVTADQKLICAHDESISRRLIHSANYEDLCKLYLKSYRDKTLSEIAILEQILDRFASRAFLDIELKVPGMEQAVAHLVRELDPNRYVVSSFLPEVLQSIHQVSPGIPLGYISRRLDALRIWPSLPTAYVIPRHDIVSHELLAAVHESGRKLLTWTVNRASEMRTLADWGVDGLISDDPELLSETLRFRE